MVAVLFSLSSDKKILWLKKKVNLFYIVSLRIDFSPERLGILHWFYTCLRKEIGLCVTSGVMEIYENIVSSVHSYH